MRLPHTLSICALLLSGCAYMPLGTAARLAAFNPLMADAGGLVVTLDLPDGVGLVPGSETLKLEAERQASGETSQGTYVLDRLLHDGALAYRIAPADLDRFRAQQALVRRWEEADPDDTRGSLSLSLEPCLIGDGPARRASLSAGISIPDQTRPMPLFQGVPVRRLLPNGTSDLPACP